MTAQEPRAAGETRPILSGWCGQHGTPDCGHCSYPRCQHACHQTPVDHMLPTSTEHGKVAAKNEPPTARRAARGF